MATWDEEYSTMGDTYVPPEIVDYLLQRPLMVVNDGGGC